MHKCSIVGDESRRVRESVLFLCCCSGQSSLRITILFWAEYNLE